jgi:hypothetical protein
MDSMDVLKVLEGPDIEPRFWQYERVCSFDERIEANTRAFQTP